MNDYTPPLARLRDEYVQLRTEHFGFSDLYAAEWDRALAAHDAEVAARALGEAADLADSIVPIVDDPVMEAHAKNIRMVLSRALRAEAARHREGGN